MSKKIIYLIISILGIACSSQKGMIKETAQQTSDRATDEETYTAPNNGAEDDIEYTEERTLDELVVTAPTNYVLPVYHESEEQVWDLLHMDLDVRFDWTNEHVIGRADLKLKPFFYSQEDLQLDAKGFEILDISDSSGKTLEYNYNGKKINIILPMTYSREDEMVITIDYIAKPSEGPEGGSAAITSDKGLFFINPKGDQIDKPQQIWTQGETENNSRWFPTIDKPNERMTQDITLTVQDKFVTLSNGTLVSSKNHPDGKRTDHWKMDQPHAPYLAMIAVGEFSVITDEVDGLPLEYFVEPEYEPYAKEIFAHTPEMIRFFSELLDYPYPWDKFSQIITRDYVSGAMENTTAVIYGDFIQKTDRELIDDSNDYIIAHEMFHHWFGDLVTVESWANLTLQEGFANYSEYLWEEHKNGKDAAEFHRKNELKGYLASIMQGDIHPLIHYGYGDKEEMFDAHSYNKGGQVLHMLRNQIGDEAFFAGLHKYLTDNKHTAVEVDELRMAFEDVSGLDLQWFFNQWFLSAGHPIIEVAYDYNAIAGEIIVNVEQTQDPESSRPIFLLPVTVSVYNTTGVETQFDMTIDEREDEIVLAYDEEPALIVFDKNDHLLKVITESKTAQEYMNQYEWVDSYTHRQKAINKIKSKKEAAALIVSALEDNHFSIRKTAVESVKLGDNPDLIAQILKMAKSDRHSAVRGAAIKKLRGVESIDINQLITEVLSSEQSYRVISDALETLNLEDKNAALSAAINLKKEATTQLTGAVSRILAESGDPSHLSYFDERLTSVSLFSIFNFYDSYYKLLSQSDAETQLGKAQLLKDIASSQAYNMYYRFTSTTTLDKLRNDLKLDQPDAAIEIDSMIEEIKAVETNEFLLQRYSGF